MRTSPAVPAIIGLAALTVLLVFGITAYSDYKAVTPAPTPATDDGTGNAEQKAPKIDFANPSIGPTDAPLTIVVYGDYLCGACGDQEKTLLETLKEFSGKFRLVWKDLPNETAHPGAGAMAEAARCAGLQGQFWSMHDRLFANQDTLNGSSLPALAEGLNMDTNAFQSCVTDRSAKPLIDRDVEEAVALKIDATPYMFVGTRRISGAMGAAELKTVIAAQLEAATPKAKP